MSDHNDNPELDLFQADGRSQFDLIKNVRADGSEFWSARELAIVMGYSEWRNFEIPIDRAMRSAANQQIDVDRNFVGSRKVSGKRGPARADFELSRFAAYLVAMNGDPNKMEVAAAQSYFAIKTREAETAQPSALTDDEIVARALAITTARVKELESVIGELEPDANAWRKLADADGNYSVADAAKILAQDPKIQIGRDRLFRFMESKKWIYKRKSFRGGWCAYQNQIDTGRLHERPNTPFLNRQTGEYELPAPTIRVTVKGIGDLHRLLVPSTEVTR